LNIACSGEYVAKWRTIIERRSNQVAGEEGGDRHDVFRLVSPYAPAGDQPAAIAALTEGLKSGTDYQTLLGGDWFG